MDSKNIVEIFNNDENIEDFKLFINFLENYYNNNKNFLITKNIDFLKILINLTKKCNNINELKIAIGALINEDNFGLFLYYFIIYYDEQNEETKKNITPTEGIIYIKYLLWKFKTTNYDFGDWYSEYKFYGSLINLIDLYCSDTDNKNIEDIIELKLYINNYSNTYSNTPILDYVESEYKKQYIEEEKLKELIKKNYNLEYKY